MGKINNSKTNLLKSHKVPNINKVSKAKQKISVKSSKINLPINTKNITKEILSGNNVNASNLSSENQRNNFSYKTVKFDKHNKQIFKKKDKLHLKRELLMKKLNNIKEVKKEMKAQEKRKNNSIIGDTTLLRDALPALEPLIQNKFKKDTILAPKTLEKRKAIETTKQRKKKVAKDIDLFKRAINDNYFKKNPFKIISGHIQAVVERERNTN